MIQRKLNMKMIWIVALLALAGCYGGKPSMDVEGNDTGCIAIRDRLDDYHPDAIFKETEYGDKNCACVETTTCYNKPVCSIVRCTE
jgi:hypothetical protein